MQDCNNTLNISALYKDHIWDSLNDILSWLQFPNSDSLLSFCVFEAERWNCVLQNFASGSVTISDNRALVAIPAFPVSNTLARRYKWSTTFWHKRCQPLLQDFLIKKFIACSIIEFLQRTTAGRCVNPKTCYVWSVPISCFTRKLWFLAMQLQPHQWIFVTMVWECSLQLWQVFSQGSTLNINSNNALLTVSEFSVGERCRLHNM